MRMNAIDWLSMGLVIVGAVNWGLVGLLRFNLVNALFGGIPLVESAVYAIVGLAGLYLIYTGAKLSSGATRTA
ncbi:MAG TPA: DUF378 domain-containing protein [Chloroflexota bacterium]